MEQKNENLLPIGTVVLLKNAEKRLMIIGYCAANPKEGDKNPFDYKGCLFPEGIIDMNSLFGFNKEQIDKVYHKGLQDKEQEEFGVKVTKLVEKMRDEKFIAELQQTLGQIQNMFNEEIEDDRKTTKTDKKSKENEEKKEEKPEE